MRLSFTALAASFAFAPLAAAFGGHGMRMDVGPDDVSDADLQKRAALRGWGTFDQLIDHSNKSLGTFKQRYWYGTEHWKGPGSPIYLISPGEQSGDGFNRTWLTSQRLSGLMAKETGGAIVILEHRYWGESSPYTNLTEENLKYLTLENALKDHIHFAKTFVPPFDKSGNSSADKAPWIFVGGSYSGALAGWLAAKEPGTFWAYYSSSGVVEAIGDFWQYFVPVQEATPKNCSSDVGLVIDYVDYVLTHGSKKKKQALKAKFGLKELNDADFAATLEWGPWQWQSGQFYSEYQPFYLFCDYVENVWPNSTHKVPGPHGVGLSKALDGYAKYIKEQIIPGACEAAGYPEWKGEYNIECFKNSDPDNVAYKDLSLDNWINRQWNWMLCNEPFEWWQDGAPRNRSTLVSRLVTADYWRKQCALHFPNGGYSLAEGKRAKDVNKWTGGWSVTNTTRAMHTNGQYDPWRDATLSSKFRPGGPVQSTEQLPVRVVKGGMHCSDLYGANWEVNEGVKNLALDATEQMTEWVKEWYEEKGLPVPWDRSRN